MMDIQDVFDMSKKQLKELGEQSPRYLVFDGDELIVIEFENNDSEETEERRDFLRRFLEEKNIEKYFMCFSGYVLDAERLEKYAKDVLKKAKSEPEMVKAMAHLLYLRELPPSKNPCSTNALFVMSFDKKNGTEGISQGYEIDEEEIKFNGKTTTLEGVKQMYAKMNVWNQWQVNIGDENE